MSLRIVFFGTPEFAVPTLSEIVGQGHDVVAAYTQPPRPAGRGMGERRSPVHETAIRLGIPVFTPARLRAEGELEQFRVFDADVGVVVAYGQILPAGFLQAPEHGCLNLHGSLLPRWRGAAPVARAIMAGDAETGVMVMRMEEGLDTGPVAMSERVAIEADVTAGELSSRLALLGADLMARAVAALSRGGLTFVPQAPEGATYAKKIDKGETRIDWARPAAEVHNHIRGLSPDPGAWFEIATAKGPERVRALRSTLGGDATGVPPGTILPGVGLTVACGAGSVQLLNVQRAGRQPVAAAEFLRGFQTPIARLD